jgi:hypothetical protein
MYASMPVYVLNIRKESGVTVSVSKSFLYTGIKSDQGEVGAVAQQMWRGVVIQQLAARAFGVRVGSSVLSFKIRAEK